MAADHVERGDRAPVRERDARERRDAQRARHARHDVDRHARRAAREHLLAAAPVDERVAALEPHDAPPALRLLDEDRVDLVLRHGVVPGGLADVDHLDAGRELVEHVDRPEPVRDDDVRLRERPAAPEGEQVHGARSPAHERHAPETAGRRAVAPLVGPAGAQVLGDRVAHRARPPRVGASPLPRAVGLSSLPSAPGRGDVRDDPDEHVAAAGRRGRARGALVRGPGVDAPGAARGGPRGDVPVGPRVVRRREHEPRVLEVGLADVARRPGDATTRRDLAVGPQPGG